MYGVLVFYFENEELKNTGKNLIQRLEEGRDQSTYVDGLTSLKEGEYKLGQENETIFSLFYSTMTDFFVKDMYKFFLHFFPSDSIVICDFVCENDKDFCCFSNFLDLNGFCFNNLPKREELCESIDMEFIEKNIS